MRIYCCRTGESIMKKAQRIQTIRFLFSMEEGGDSFEILKLSLASNTEDFYLHLKKNEIKVSFHKDGKKYLRFQNGDDKYGETLYEKENYILDGINPIFSYFPSEIGNYKTRTTSVESRTMKVSFEAGTADFGVNVFWVNADGQDEFLLSSNSCNTKAKFEKHLTDGTSERGAFDIPTAIEFGQQTLFFDIFEIKRSSAERKYEMLRIYKPGTKNHILAHTNYVVNADINSLKQQGCSIVKNQNNGYYTLVY